MPTACPPFPPSRSLLAFSPKRHAIPNRLHVGTRRVPTSRRCPLQAHASHDLRAVGGSLQCGRAVLCKPPPPPPPPPPFPQAPGPMCVRMHVRTPGRADRHMRDMGGLIHTVRRAKRKPHASHHFHGPRDRPGSSPPPSRTPWLYAGQLACPMNCAAPRPSPLTSPLPSGVSAVRSCETRSAPCRWCVLLLQDREMRD